MRIRSLLAAALLALAFAVACQPAPGGGESAPAEPSQATSSDAAAPAAPSETPQEYPNY